MSRSRVLLERAHRPWPLPHGPWVMMQTWEDLLFAHWPVPPQALRELVPQAIPIDCFDGSAWVSVTPFEVTGLRVRGTPPVPGVSRFPELNVRTYTTLDGKPGIWFFSLDAGSAAAVFGARLTYRLPYFRARMSIERRAAEIAYRSKRDGHDLLAEYRADGPAAPAAPGTLDHWLTERYCLYAMSHGRVLRAEIHHPPWPLQPAAATLHRNTMAPVALAGEPLVQFARRQDVLVWPPRHA